MAMVTTIKKQRLATGLGEVRRRVLNSRRVVPMLRMDQQEEEEEEEKERRKGRHIRTRSHAVCCCRTELAAAAAAAGQPSIHSCILWAMTSSHDLSRTLAIRIQPFPFPFPFPFPLPLPLPLSYLEHARLLQPFAFGRGI